MTEYYHKLMRSFYMYFGKTIEHHREKDLHQMRVGIKKLKAEWSMIESICGEQWSKSSHYELFRDLFKSAGKFRETQISLKLFENHYADKFIAYTQFLINTKTEYRNLLIEKMKAFDFEELRGLNQKLDEVLHQLSDETIILHSKMFINSKFEKTLLLVEKLPDDPSLHKIRIHLKAVVEILRIIRKLKPDPELKKLRKQIISFNEELGTWHDYIVLLDSMQEYDSDLTHNSDSKDFGLAIQEIQNEVLSKQTKIESHIKNKMSKESFRTLAT